MTNTKTKKSLLFGSLVAVILTVFSALSFFLLGRNEVQAETVIPEISADTNENGEKYLDVIAANLKYGDYVYIYYAVDMNLEGVGDESKVKMLFWNTPQSEYTLDAGTHSHIARIDGKKNTLGNNITLGENTYTDCAAFSSYAIAPKEFGDTVYARAYIECEDGRIKYSNAVKYSVLEYVYSRRAEKAAGGNVKDEQLKLYSEILNYGANSQKVLNYKTDRLVTGDVSYIEVEGGRITDGFTSGYYIAGDEITIVADSSSYFIAWTDSDGNTVSEERSYTFAVTPESDGKVYKVLYELPLTDFTYSLSADGSYYTVTDYKGSDTEVTIPESYNGIPIEAIGDSAFKNCTSIISVSIPESVTSIGDYAFESCTGLASIDIPDSVTSIGEYAFYNCSSLTEINCYWAYGEKPDVEASQPWGAENATVNYTAHIHSFTNYIYNNDASCTQDGTKTAICDNGCGATDTVDDPDYPILNHSYDQFSDEPKYFAGYVSNEYASGIKFFQSCSYCGRKSPYIFENHISYPDTIDSQEIPLCMEAGTLIYGEINGVNVTRGMRVLTEETENGLNCFLRYQQINNPASYPIRFKQDYIENCTTYYYCHSFRWCGADNVKEGNRPLLIRFLDTSSSSVVNLGGFLPNAAEGEDFTITQNGKTVTVPLGEWASFIYRLDKLEDGKWLVTLYVNGVEAQKFTTHTASDSVPTLVYEPRYQSAGSDHSINNMMFDFDNVDCFSGFEKYKITVCEDGEHDFGEWFYDNALACTDSVTKYRVCLNVFCNCVEEELISSTGHNMQYTYNNDATCTQDGTKTGYCINGCGLLETIIDTEHPAFGHKMSDYVYNNDASCTSDGTKTSVCQNENCDLTDTVIDPEYPSYGGHAMSAFCYNHDAECTKNGTKTAVCQNPNCYYSQTIDDEDHLATGHSLGDFTYNEDAICDFDGTKSALCDFCNTTITVPDPDHPAPGHIFTDYILAQNSATCQHGTAYIASCDNYCGATDTHYTDDILDYHSYVAEIYDSKYFACYTDDNSAIIFFKSCEWCGRKSPYTFKKVITPVDTLDSYTFPEGFSVNHFKSDGEIPETGAWAVFVSEEVGEAVNYYLNIGKQDYGAGHTIIFKSTAEGKKSYVYEFDFRWNHASNLRYDGINIGNIIIWAKIYSDKQVVHQITCDDPSSYLYYEDYNVSIYNGKWHRIRYEFTRSEDNSGWDIITTIDGEEVAQSKNFVAGTSTPKLTWETRYGQGSSTCNVNFDIDNISIYDKVTELYVNTNCSDGEHSYGEWFTKEADCLNDGKFLRVCLVDGCNSIDEVIDNDNPAYGHSFTNYISDNNAQLGIDGTKTAECDHGCGATDTVTDEGSSL